MKKIIESKREYRQAMERVKKLPDDYQFVFKKIQEYMWSYGSGSGYDMMEIHYDLIELFEHSANEGKSVLKVTGDDVAAFCEELLRNASTYTENRNQKLNKEIHKKLSQ